MQVIRNKIAMDYVATALKLKSVPDWTGAAKLFAASRMGGFPGSFFDV